MQPSAVPPGAGFAYETAKTALDDQLRRIESLDAKASLLVAAGGVLSGLLLSSDSLISRFPDAILLVGGILLVASLVFSLAASLNRRYVTAPRPQAVSLFALASEDWLKWRFIGNLHLALEWNGRKVERKAQLLPYAQLSLIAAVALVGGYFVSTTFLELLGGVQ